MKSSPDTLDRPRTETPLRRAVALIGALCYLASMQAAAQQQADPACGNPFVNGYGPFDYRTQQASLKIVEDYHFTPRVESLIGGMQGTIGGDLNYTLRAFPNHHRALVAMMRLGERLKTPIPPGAVFSVECFFKRALLFRPDDSVARMLYSKYLFNVGNKNDALRELDYTRETTKDNAFTHYNLGLLYQEFGAFDRALEQAHRALALGFGRPELKAQLQKAGKWSEPTAAPAETAASAPPPPLNPHAEPGSDHGDRAQCAADNAVHRHASRVATWSTLAVTRRAPVARGTYGPRPSHPGRRLPNPSAAGLL